MTRVSIITATFNSSKTIRDTLESVANQRYEAIEHLIIDGLSSDDTLKVVEGFPHVSRVISEKDKGIYDAMNKGIGLASGDIIGILNSDDVYASDEAIGHVLKIFSETGCDAVYGDLLYVDQHDLGKVKRYWRSGAYKTGDFLWGWMPPHPTLFVKKELYQKYGVFRLDLKTAADYELMLRFIHCNGIQLSYLPEILVKMRAGGASNASLSGRIRANQADRMAWKVNQVTPYWFTLYLKPLRKLGQFFKI